MNGTTCDDSNGVTVEDRCVSGTCVGLALCENITCPLIGQCYDTGVCDITTGLCSSAVLVGKTCNDGNTTTVNDRCTSNGTCRGNQLH